MVDEPVVGHENVFNLDFVKRPEEDPEANMNEFDCPELFVDAGTQESEPVYLSNDSKFVPMHVLLNGECQVMKRLKYPKHVGKKFQRFIQIFVVF